MRLELLDGKSKRIALLLQDKRRLLVASLHKEVYDGMIRAATASFEAAALERGKSEAAAGSVSPFGGDAKALATLYAPRLNLKNLLLTTDY